MTDRRWWKKWRGGHQQKWLSGNEHMSSSKIQWDGILEPSSSDGVFDCVVPAVGDGDGDGSLSGGGGVSDCIVLVVRNRGEWGRSGSVDRSYIRGRHHKLHVVQSKVRNVSERPRENFYRFRKDVGAASESLTVAAVVKPLRCILIHMRPCLEASQAAGW